MACLIFTPNIFISIIILTFILIMPRIVSAKVFNIPSGDVAKLIEAINEANSNDQADTIKLKAGTYSLIEVNNNTAGANGLPSITSNIRIIGAGADKTIIERDQNAPPFRIFHVDASGTLGLDKLTLKNGLTILDFFNDPTFESGNGGGIYNNGGNVTITSSIISENEMDGAGGGIYNNRGKVAITSSIISENKSESGSGSSGGGIANNGGKVDITNSTITQNFVIRGAGGNIANGGPMTLIASTVSLGGAEFGGGISGGNMYIKDSFILNNNADEGGGILAGGDTVIEGSTISGNMGFVVGGGILNFGTLKIVNSTIDNNFGFLDGGGGIMNLGNVKVINSTVANNITLFTFSASGTGINNGGFQSEGNITIINSTVANNVGTGTGEKLSGIFNEEGSTVVLVNTILALNININEFDNTSEASDCNGEIISNGNNLIGDTTDCTITLQSNDLTGDPGLGNFSDNGTPGNGHFPLLTSSQAIDAGNNDVCLDDPILATDQIGNPRRDGDGDGNVVCDIGSIEFQPPFKNLGQCISTLIIQNCSGLKGRDRADCNHQQQQFCKDLFN